MNHMSAKAVNVAYFFECGNAYDAREEYWIDICVSQPKFP